MSIVEDSSSSLLLVNRFNTNDLLGKQSDETIVKSISHNHNEKPYIFGADNFTKSWFQIIIDSSHLITFIVSILVIVYGSFKSLKIDKSISESNAKMENSDNIKTQASYSKLEGEKMNNAENIENEDNFDNENDEEDDDDEDNDNQSVQTISSKQALFIPVAASVSLLLMFFFFDSIQTAFVLCTSILATIAFSYLFTPVCKVLLRSVCSSKTINKKRRCCFLGRYRLSELLAFFFSCTLILLWIITGHWLLMDIIGIGFCITFIAIVRLPSLKVSTLLLVGLVIYDVIWVYFSHLFFNSNVMVKVATREAENPFSMLARKFNIDIRDSPKLSLPGKLVVPSYKKSGNFSILGLGDIVIPGLLLCFVLRFDAYKKNQLYQVIVSSTSSSNGTASGSPKQDKSKNEKHNKNNDDCCITIDNEEPHLIECSCLNCKLNDFQQIKINGLKGQSYNSKNENKSTGQKGLKRYLSYPFFFSKNYYINLSRLNANGNTTTTSYSIINLIRFNKLSYFHCSLIGYFIGLITATLSSEIFREAQPALLYLVPFTLLPLLTMAYLKGDLKYMWNEPFSYSTPKYFNI